MSTPEGPRAFARFIECVADGDAHTELSNKLQALTALLEERAMVTSGIARGTLTLTLAIAVDARGQAAVGYETKVKEPPPPRQKSTFWVTKGGNLSPEHPRQHKLPLREVSAPRVSEGPAEPATKSY